VNGTNANFEMQAAYEEENPEDGTADDGAHYMAVGFSDDDDMGEDTVIAASGRFVSLYYNYAGFGSKSALLVGDNSAISDTQEIRADGAFYARFTIPVSFSYIAPTPSGPVDVTNDLAAGKFVLAASGLSLGPKLGYHSFRSHTDDIATP